jgi:LemA protein
VFTSSMLWIAAPLLLFWSVGAYNRLIRLRGDARAAFNVLAAELDKQVAMARECLPEGEEPGPNIGGGEHSVWGGLQGAAGQLAASLAAARQQPLDPPRIEALGAAQGVLQMAWERVEREDAHDLAGSRLAEDVSLQRAHLASQAEAAADQFNLAVARYNRGVRQFPALLLARLFGLRPAQGLGLP